MIRFVDLRPAKIAGTRFAFWDTVRDRFITIEGEQAWEYFGELREHEIHVDLPRLRMLCPPWVHVDPVDGDEFEVTKVSR